MAMTSTPSPHYNNLRSQVTVSLADWKLALRHPSQESYSKPTDICKYRALRHSGNESSSSVTELRKTYVNSAVADGLISSRVAGDLLQKLELLTPIGGVNDKLYIDEELVEVYYSSDIGSATVNIGSGGEFTLYMRNKRTGYDQFIESGDMKFIQVAEAIRNFFHTCQRNG